MKVKLVVILFLVFALFVNNTYCQNTSKNYIQTRFGELDTTEVIKLLPQKGILRLVPVGSIEEYFFSHPQYQDTVKQRLQSLLPEDVELRYFNEIEKTHEQKIIGDIYIDGKRQQWILTKQTGATITSMQHATSVSPTYSIIGRYEDHLLSIRVKMKRAYYHEYKICRTTNWDNYIIMSDNKLISETEYKTKISTEEEIENLMNSSSLWTKISNFQYQNAEAFNFVLLSFSYSALSNKIISFTNSPLSKYQNSYGLRFDAHDIAGKTKIKFITSVGFDIIKLHNSMLMGIDLIANKFFLINLNIIRIMPYIGLGNEFYLLMANSNDESKEKFLLDPSISLGTDFIIPIQNNWNLFVGLKARQPFIKHEGNINFKNTSLNYLFDNKIYFQVEGGFFIHLQGGR